MLNYKDYFQDNNQYYEAKTIVSVLENIMDMNISDLKEYVNNLKVDITKEEIEAYLEQKFTEENLELKERIEYPKLRQNKNIDVLTVQDIKEAARDFTDRVIAKKYHFEPYTLEYFNRYTSIVQNKAKRLLNIIEKIGDKDTILINDELVDLDIVLDENGNILKSDMIRLIEPTVYNIEDLNQKVSKANDLSTYLTFKMSLNSIYRDGLSEGEVYPYESLQQKNLFVDYTAGNVRLSENQEEKIKEHRRKSMKLSIESLLD